MSSSLTRQDLRQQLERDVLAADFLISIFWAAMSSFRHDTILRPFPPLFVRGAQGGGERRLGGGEEQKLLLHEEEKDMDRLRASFDSIPPLNKLLEGDCHPTLNQSSSNLVKWLTSPKGFTVSYQPTSLLKDLIPKTEKHLGNLQYMFEIDYNEKNNAKFQSVMKDYGTLYAFHGSSVENFHSIIYNGLLNMFNKASAFGEGTYLSTDIGVCLNWSPSGALWPKSLLTPTASCVAVCEVVKHPSVMSRSQLGGEPNIQGKVPEEYFIVSNDEFVRVKYVLLFGRKRLKQATPYYGSLLRSGCCRWLYQHLFAVVIVTYIVLLLIIGLVSSKLFRRIFRKYFR